MDADFLVLELPEFRQPLLMALHIKIPGHRNIPFGSQGIESPYLFTGSTIGVDPERKHREILSREIPKMSVGKAADMMEKLQASMQQCPDLSLPDGGNRLCRKPVCTMIEAAVSTPVVEHHRRRIKRKRNNVSSSVSARKQPIFLILGPESIRLARNTALHHDIDDPDIGKSAIVQSMQIVDI
jgi:hypothetical protein